MPGRIKFVTFLGAVFATTLSFSVAATASPQGGLKDGQADLGKAQARLTELRQDAGTSYEAYNNAVYQLGQTDAKIEKASGELKATEEQLAQAQGALGAHASQAYRNDNLAFLDVLVDVSSFSEFSSRLNVWMHLLGRERAEVERVRDAKDRLAQVKAELGSQREQRLAAVREAEGKRAQASRLEAESHAYLNSLNSELKSKVQAEEEKQSQKAQAAAAQTTKQLAQSNSQTLAPQNTAVKGKASGQVTASGEAGAGAPANADPQGAVPIVPVSNTTTAGTATGSAGASYPAAGTSPAASAGASSSTADTSSAETTSGSAGTSSSAADTSSAGASSPAADTSSTGTTSDSTPVTDPGSGQTGTGASSGQATSSNSGGSGEAVVSEAQTWLGVPYVWGGDSRSGVDCSGLVMQVFSKFGISLPHSAAGQYGYGSSVSTPGAGDVVFWSDGSDGITHDGIATGNGTVIHAPYPGTVVREEAIWSSGYVGSKSLL